MTNSLQARKGFRRMAMGLVLALVILIVGGVGIGLLWPGNPWGSVALGMAASLGIFGISRLTVGQTLAAPEPSVLWVAVDYIAKIFLTIIALLIAKALPSMDVKVVAVIVIAAIVLTTVVLVTAFAPRPRTAVPLDLDD